jgi:predicted dehydrogenase
MSKRLRIGLIGTSGYAELAFLSTLSAHEDVKVAALCGRDRTRTQAVASKYNIPETFTDYQEMIRRGRLDAVIVAAPDDLHYPMTMAALQAGLHVLCEKPMARNATEAAEMLEAAERANVKHMLEFTWRWMPHFQYLHHLVSEGFVGQGFHYYFHFHGGWGRNQRYAWRFDSARSNGILGDSGSHMVDLALWLCGDIDSVSAHLASFHERTNAEGQLYTGPNETAALTVTFADGAQGMIHVSNIAHRGNRGMTQAVSLHGEAGAIETEWSFLGEAEQGVIMRAARQEEKEFRNLEVPEEFLHGVSNGDIGAVFSAHLIGPRLFVDSVLHDYMPTPNFRQGYRVQQVIDAAIESHTTGRRISLGY